MSRRISISKKDNITLVIVSQNGVNTRSSSSIRRVVTEYLNGVKIEPHPEEPEFNNLYIPLDELEDTFGAKTPKELHDQFIDRGFFSGAANSSTPGVNINQNNKIVEIELPSVNVPLGTSNKDALSTQINQYSIDLKEDEILIVRVGHFIQGGSVEGGGK